MPIPTRRSWLPWAVALGLGILQWRLLAGFENHHDLHPDDEIHYLQQGLAVAAGQWPPSWLAWSPVESLAYALLHGIGVPAAARPDVMIVFGSVVGTLALFWCLLRPCGVAGALLAATSWATMPLPLVGEFPTLQPSTYMFSAALAWAGLGCLLRRHGLPGVLLLGCAALDRGELAPALLLGGGAGCSSASSASPSCSSTRSAKAIGNARGWPSASTMRSAPWNATPRCRGPASSSRSR